MSKQVCSICGRPQHFGTCAQVRNWGKVDGKVLRNEALNTAIERGERLEAIAELSGAWIRRDGYSGATALRLLKRIYKLAKPVGVPIPQPPRIMV